MNVGKILTAGIAVGIALVVVDYVGMNFILGNFYASQPYLNQTPTVGLVWNYIGDFVAALVFVWVFDRVRGSFGPGLGGGLTYGLYAGVLMNFPLWIFMHMWVKDFSYSAAWVFTIWGLAVALIMGAVTGAVYGRGMAKAAA
jgi:hypothetical protein